MGVLANLARMITPRQKANPAGEGNYHPGPYTVGGGILPSEWGQYLNFWQMDLDPIAGPGCSTVEACVWAYIRAIAQLPGYHKRELDKRRHRDGDDLGVVAAAAGAERLPDAVRFPGAPDPLVALHRQLVLDRATQRPPGGRGAALDRPAHMPRARGAGRRPGIQRDILRDRRQPADQHVIVWRGARWWCRRATCCTSSSTPAAIR